MNQRGPDKGNDKRTWNPADAPTYWINQISRLLLRNFEERLRPLEFGVAYFPVISAIEGCGPLTQKALADLAFVEQPTMAALLNRMDKDGLIKREKHPMDGRASLISLSEKANNRIPEARQRLTEVADKATKGFSEEEQRELISMLRRMIENLRQ